MSNDERVTQVDWTDPNIGHLVDLLHREAAHSGVWFADHLSGAAALIEDAQCLLAAKSAPPAGWVVVPREPSEAMQQAAFDVIEINVPRTDSRYANGTAARDAIYRAMIAAAPQPVATGEDAEVFRSALATALGREMVLRQAMQRIADMGYAGAPDIAMRRIARTALASSQPASAGEVG